MANVPVQEPLDSIGVTMLVTGPLVRSPAGSKSKPDQFLPAVQPDPAVPLTVTTVPGAPEDSDSFSVATAAPDPHAVQATENSAAIVPPANAQVMRLDRRMSRNCREPNDPYRLSAIPILPTATSRVKMPWPRYTMGPAERAIWPLRGCQVRDRDRPFRQGAYRGLRPRLGHGAGHIVCLLEMR
jgi:hypothetical protein